jgi:hypothetical protein
MSGTRPAGGRAASSTSSRRHLRGVDGLEPEPRRDGEHRQPGQLLRGRRRLDRAGAAGRARHPHAGGGAAGEVAAAVWTPGGELRVVHAFTTGDDAITAIDLIADPERLRQIDLVIVDA